MDMEQLRWGAAIAVTGINSIKDIRCHRIYTGLTIGAALTGVFLACMEWTGGLIELLTGVLIGLAALFLAWVTREAIGYGDGVVLLMLGILLGGSHCFAVAMAAIIASGIWALGLIVFFHKNRKYEMPFIPFLFGGLIWVRCITWI